MVRQYNEWLVTSVAGGRGWDEHVLAGGTDADGLTHSVIEQTSRFRFELKARASGQVCTNAIAAGRGSLELVLQLQRTRGERSTLADWSEPHM